MLVCLRVKDDQLSATTLDPSNICFHFIFAQVDETIASAANMSGRQMLRSIAVSFRNGRDECQMLCVNFFSATASQARESCRHNEFDLVAKALQQTLQLERARSFRDCGMKIIRQADDA